MTRKAAIIGGGVNGGGWAARLTAAAAVWAKLTLEKRAPVGR